MIIFPGLRAAWVPVSFAAGSRVLTSHLRSSPVSR